MHHTYKSVLSKNVLCIKNVHLNMKYEMIHLKNSKPDSFLLN